MLNTAAARSITAWSDDVTCAVIASLMAGSFSIAASRLKYSRVIGFSATGILSSCTRASARDSAAIALSCSGTEPWPDVPLAVAMTLYPCFSVTWMLML